MKRWFCGSVINAGDDAPKTSVKPTEAKAIWGGSSSLWVCGNWQQQQLITLADGSVHMTIIGTCLAAREVLLEQLQRAARSRDYSLLMQLPGNYNTIVHIENDTYVFVDAMGVRSVFYAIWHS